MMSAAVFWGLLLTVITESLSPFYLLTTSGIAGAWTLMLLLIVLAGRRRLRLVIHHLKVFPGLVHWSLAPWIAGVAGIVMVTGLIAIVAPPNTWDAMTYHMSRVAHWIQNQSVEHYPSHTEVQLYRPPWAEFTILHFQILSHGDRFANVVQWLSMVGSVVVVTVLARQLGADPQGQVYAAVVAATIPIGILEASSTQTDYVGTFWLACFVSFTFTMLEARPDPHPWSLALKVGASLGLALLTRPSNFFYTAPFLIWLGLAIKKTGDKRGWAALMLVLLIALAVNLGHFSRNVSLYGTPTGPRGEEMCLKCKQTNDAYALPLILSNVVRNMAPHLATPFEPLNLALESAIQSIHSWMGISVDDQRITWERCRFAVKSPTYDEDMDGNLFHFLLGISTAVILFVPGRVSIPVLIRGCAAALVVGFLLLCLVVKWQPYQPRLHLPLFVLWSPLVAVMLARCRSRLVTNVVIALLVVCALPWLILNVRRPLITVPAPTSIVVPYQDTLEGNVGILEAPRSSIYFYYGRRNFKYKAAFLKAVRLFKEHGCFRIGLFKGWNDWEYPLWPLLQRETREPIRIEHLGVPGPSRKLAEREPFASFSPCAYMSISASDVTVLFLPNVPASQPED